MATETEIVIATIGAIATILAVSIPYYQTKNKEINNRIKEKRLERYDGLLSKFTQYLSDPLDQEHTAEFIEAYNMASAYASNAVLQACNDLLLALRDQTEKRKVDPTYTIPDAEQDKLISDVFKAIRKDVRPNDPNFSFIAFTQVKNKSQ